MSTRATLNGISISSVELNLPRHGAWVFNVEVFTSKTFVIGDEVTLKVLVDEVIKSTYVGTVKAVSGYTGRRSLTVLAGKGNQHTSLVAKHWSEGSAIATVVKNTLASVEGGGTISESSVTSPFLQHWTTVGGQPLSKELTALARAVGPNEGAVWRQSEDGTYLFVIDEFEDADIDLNKNFQDVSKPSEQVTKTYAARDYVNTLSPGSTINGQRAGRLSWTIAGDRIQLVITTDGSTRTDNEKKSSVDTNLREFLLSRPWIAQVVSQDSSTKRLNLNPEEVELQGLGLNDVPIMFGFPGSCNVASGQKVVLAFFGGDPQRPFVYGFENTQTSEIKLGEASDYVALSTLVTEQLQALKDAMSNAVTVPNDGGASLKSTYLAALAAFPGSVAAEKVKAE